MWRGRCAQSQGRESTVKSQASGVHVLQVSMLAECGQVQRHAPGCVCRRDMPAMQLQGEQGYCMTEWQVKPLIRTRVQQMA